MQVLSPPATECKCLVLAACGCLEQQRVTRAGGACTAGFPHLVKHWVCTGRGIVGIVKGWRAQEVGRQPSVACRERRKIGDVGTRG